METEVTALFQAAYNGNVELVTQLLHANVDVNTAEETCDLTPLHIAAQEGYIEVVTLLLAAGAEVNNAAKRGNSITPLHLALAKGNLEIVVLLLNAGADVNAKVIDGTTPLHWATLGCHSKVIQLLLTQAIADINSQSSHGATPLHYAARNGNIECVRHLLAAGAQKEIKDTTNCTALDRAKANGCQEIVELLEEAIRAENILKIL